MLLFLILCLAIYLLIGFSIKLYYRKRLISRVFNELDDYILSESVERINSIVIHKVYKIEYMYDISPNVKYLIFWPVSLIVESILKLFKHISRLSDNRDKSNISNLIKKRKLKYPQKYI